MLERANIKLAAVVTDIMGVSGRAMGEALIAGHADPATRAARARGQLRSKIPLLEQGPLSGLVRPQHRLLLATQLAHLDFLEEQIDTLRTAIARCLADLRAAADTAPPAPPEAAGRCAPVPTAQGTPLTFTQAVALLDTSPGVDRRGAQLLGAEIGIDRARFGSAKRLAAWAGVAPGNDESAGKRRSGKTRKGNRPLRTGLVQLAHGAARTKQTYLSALYRRLAARRGKKRALMAVAHAILVSAFHMLCSYAVNLIVSWGPPTILIPSDATRPLGA
ncbi:MAG: hypothetical protein KatS3mg131_2859 [Candidatus Tectimicrobiota bacterium]|nr:MAG: hypothetical protein KatS3mg131_2859 [Candidatus Tectomicrobia bacterium]